MPEVDWYVCQVCALGDCEGYVSWFALVGRSVCLFVLSYF